MAVSRYPHRFRIFIPTVVSCPGLPQSIRQVAPPLHKILRRDYNSYNRGPDKIHFPPVRSDCIGPNAATNRQLNT